MIKSSFSMLCAVLCVSLIASAHAAGYKAGAADSVKSWGTRDYENVKTAGLPICVYFYDPANNNNSRAKFLEGPDLLSNKDVKDNLKGFLILKIKTDGSDAKGWPAEMTGRAGKGGAIMLASSDLQQMFFFDRDMQMSEIKSANFIAQATNILHYEKKVANAPDKDGKEKKDDKNDKKGPMPPPEEKKGPGVPGLALGKDDKKDDKKPTEVKKKPVAPADE